MEIAIYDMMYVYNISSRYTALYLNLWLRKINKIWDSALKMVYRRVGCHQCAREKLFLWVWDGCCCCCLFPSADMDFHTIWGGRVECSGTLKMCIHTHTLYMYQQLRHPHSAGKKGPSKLIIDLMILVNKVGSRKISYNHNCFCLWNGEGDRGKKGFICRWFNGVISKGFYFAYYLFIIIMNLQLPLYMAEMLLLFCLTKKNFFL